jgi:transcriptional regulator with XRE-family HTH domain
MPGMSTPGRRIGTPTEYRDAIIDRTRQAREKLGLTMTEMAEKLTERCQRPISADTYRQWEKETTLPLDVILPLCDIAGIHPFKFLESVPFSKTSVAQPRSKKSAA